MKSWINLLQNYVNVFYLTWDFLRLPCETWNAHLMRTCYHRVVSQNFETSTMASEFAGLELRKSVYKSRITDLDYLRRHWRMAAAMTSLIYSLAHSVLSRCFSLSSDSYFEHLLSHYSPHSVILDSNLANLDCHS